MREGNFDFQNAGWLESLIDLGETRKSLNRQTRAYQQDQRKHDLHDHQGAAHAPFCPGDGARAGFFQNFVRFNAAGVEHCGKSEKNSHAERGKDGEGENVAIDANAIPTRHPFGPPHGNTGAQGAHAGKRSRDGYRSGRGRIQKRFREEELSQPAASRAKRRA